MLSKETESKVVNILKIIASGEISIEVTRNILSDNLDFDPYQIFSNLAQKGNEFITPTDIVNYFQTKNIFISYTEAKLLILFYDQNYDGVLTFTEFLPLVQSKNIKKKNTINSPIKKINQDIDFYLIKLFQKELDLVKEIIKNLYDLRIKKDFNCHSIYHAIKNVNKITEDSIGDFFDKNHSSFINDELIAIMKRLDINKDGIIDLCELHAFFGFSNCSFCCSCTPCPSCGISCCNECLSDIPCYLHKCIHHQCHSPLETKTICNSPLKNRNFSPENSISTSFRNINNNININNLRTKKNYEFNNYKKNDVELEDEKNNKYENNLYKNKYLINDGPENKKSFISEKNNIELVVDYNQKKKYSSPKKYYINSQSDMGSTLYSSSPINNNFSSSILKSKKYLNYNSNSDSNSYSNLLNYKDKNRYDEGQFKEYLKLIMKIESEIEKSKIELSLCNDFNYESAFNIFNNDCNCKCFITFDNLKEGFHALGLDIKDDEVNLFLNRFDQEKCGCINFDNFILILSPYDNLYRNKIERRMCSNYLSYDTKLYFKNLLKLIISGQKKLNELRQGFSNMNDSLKNIFELIDINGCGYFYENELKKYLKDNEIFTDDKSCILLFLKLDKNRDGKVDICEFEKEFQKVI